MGSIEEVLCAVGVLREDYGMPMGRSELSLYLDNSVVVSFSFCMKMKNPAAFLGGKDRVCITAHICWKSGRRVLDFRGVCPRGLSEVVVIYCTQVFFPLFPGSRSLRWSGVSSAVFILLVLRSRDFRYIPFFFLFLTAFVCSLITMFLLFCCFFFPLSFSCGVIGVRANISF